MSAPAPVDASALPDLLTRPGVAPLLDALNGDGEETRLVGGAVRNALLGRAVHEVDMATTALPAVTAARAEAAGFKVVPTGLEHGTLTVLAVGVPFEVTTLREDVETDGRHAVVRFGRDFATDARRRDFTINALSLSQDGRVHDHTGGLADLAARRVRFIGDADRRIREDYLRILRFFRFHADYGSGALDPAGLTAAIRGRAGLARLSRERIRAEILKTLPAPGAAGVLAVMAEAGLLQAILGGVAELGRFARVAAGEPAPDPVRRLAALAVLSREDAGRLHDRLRLANDERDRLEAYARALERLKGMPHPLAAGDLRRIAATLGVSALDDALRAVEGEGRPAWTDGARAQAAAYRAGEPAPVLPLRGADLVARGVPSGRAVGAVLERARRAWLAAGCPPAWSPPESLLDPDGPATKTKPAKGLR